MFWLPAECLLTLDRLYSLYIFFSEFYVNDILSGACTPNNQPKVLKESPSTALVDANNVLGATASHFAMDIAIKKAKETGVGWVTVKGDYTINLINTNNGFRVIG